MEKPKKIEAIVESGVVAVLRGTEPDEMVKIINALLEGGIKALEITLDNPAALDMIKELSTRLKDTDAIVGAGTVLDAETARAAILAGAEFVFGPILNLEVINTCNRYGKVVIPGVMTPTEAINAYQAGADLVKIFPAGVLEEKYIKSIKGPLSQIPVISTGGINLDNAANFIEAGVEAVGVGSALLDKEAIKEGNYQLLTDKAEKFVQVVKGARK